jgi:hypothetical protein
LQQILTDHQTSTEAAQAAEALAAAAESLAYKPPKTFSLPFIWAWGAPIFTATASALVSL